MSQNELPDQKDTERRIDPQLVSESLNRPEEFDGDHEPAARALWTNSDGTLETYCDQCGALLKADLNDVDWNVARTLEEAIPDE